MAQSALEALEEAIRLRGRGNRVVTFDPEKHPRDRRGQWRHVLKELEYGDKVTTPTNITIDRVGRVTPVFVVRGGGRDTYVASSVSEAAAVAEKRHEIARDFRGDPGLGKDFPNEDAMSHLLKKDAPVKVESKTLGGATRASSTLTKEDEYVTVPGADMSPDGVAKIADGLTGAGEHGLFHQLVHLFDHAVVGDKPISAVPAITDHAAAAANTSSAQSIIDAAQNGVQALATTSLGHVLSHPGEIVAMVGHITHLAAARIDREHAEGSTRWTQARAREVLMESRLDEAAERIYREALHPRDRMGRWRDGLRALTHDVQVAMAQSTPDGPGRADPGTTPPPVLKKVEAGHYASRDGLYAVMQDGLSFRGYGHHSTYTGERGGETGVTDSVRGGEWAAIHDREGNAHAPGAQGGENLGWFDTKREAVDAVNQHAKQNGYVPGQDASPRSTKPVTHVLLATPGGGKVTVVSEHPSEAEAMAAHEKTAPGTHIVREVDHPLATLAKAVGRADPGTVAAGAAMVAPGVATAGYLAKKMLWDYERQYDREASKAQIASRIAKAVVRGGRDHQRKESASRRDPGSPTGGPSPSSGLSKDALDAWIAEHGPYAYHRTSPLNVSGIESGGIAPQDPETTQAADGLGGQRPGHVYLYTPKPGEAVPAAQFRVDLRKIDPSLLRFDEDQLTASPDFSDEDIKKWSYDGAVYDIGKSDVFPPGNKFDQPENIQRSMDMGSVAYAGEIPPSAISRNPAYWDDPKRVERHEAALDSHRKWVAQIKKVTDDYEREQKEARNAPGKTVGEDGSTYVWTKDGRVWKHLPADGKHAESYMPTRPPFDVESAMAARGVETESRRRMREVFGQGRADHIRPLSDDQGRKDPGTATDPYAPTPIQDIRPGARLWKPDTGAYGKGILSPDGTLTTWSLGWSAPGQPFPAQSAEHVTALTRFPELRDGVPITIGLDGSATTNAGRPLSAKEKAALPGALADHGLAYIPEDRYAEFRRRQDRWRTDNPWANSRPGSGRLDPGSPTPPDSDTTVGASPFLKDAAGAPTTYADALALHSDPAWERSYGAPFRKAVAEVAREHGVEVVGMTPNVGVYEGEFEPSYAISMRGDADAIEAVNRTLGEQFNQKSVVDFKPEPAGLDAQVAFSGITDPDAFFKALVGIMGGDAGAAFDGESLARVFVWHGSAEHEDTATALLALADALGIRAEAEAGAGRFLETGGTGTITA